MFFYCSRNHKHSTEAGKDICNTKYVDLRIKKGFISLKIVEEQINKPPRILEKGPFKIYIYSENKNDQYE